MNYSVEGTNVIAASEFLQRFQVENKLDELDYATAAQWTKNV